MLIAHLSDLHIAGPGKKAYGIAPTAENLALVVQHINGLVPAPDLVLVTGDITYGGGQQEVELAASLLAQLRRPCFLVPGNHDHLPSLWEGFGGSAIPAAADFMNYTIEGHAIRLIGMDSTDPGKPGGAMDACRCDWLAARLAEKPEQPTILFMHHPPVKCGVLETDEDGFAGIDRLARVVAEYDNILRVLCGHIHLEAHAAWRHILVSTAPSMGLQLGLDLTLTRPSEFYLGAPGYQLHYYHPEKHLVSHTIFVHSMNGPYPFEEPRPGEKNTTQRAEVDGL